MIKRMRMVMLLLAACAACSSPADNEAGEPPSPVRSYASQTAAPTPDYRRLLAEAPLSDGGWEERAATSPLPPDAKEIGEAWIARLKARGALLGYGLGKGPDAPANLIDTGLARAEFDAWAAENGWRVPDHIRWSFVPPLNLPSVSAPAKTAIRLWPASTARTGAQNQALFHGRVELRDGCFFVGELGKPVDKLAWFHAEVGLDVDAEGYYVLRNRISGQILARLGEEMNWGGPATAVIETRVERALREACGDAEIYIVGSPEASERFLTQYPHLRSPAPPPPPPTER